MEGWRGEGSRPEGPVTSDLVAGRGSVREGVEGTTTAPAGEAGGGCAGRQEREMHATTLCRERERESWLDRCEW